MQSTRAAGPAYPTATEKKKYSKNRTAKLDFFHTRACTRLFSHVATSDEAFAVYYYRQQRTHLTATKLFQASSGNSREIRLLTLLFTIPMRRKKDL